MSEYSPKEIEEKYYEIWKERGLFEIEANADSDKNFSIMFPPPNVTGSLHIGHALTFTLQDIIVRYKRMDGYKTLWQPGLDHAGIATQNVVEKQLLAQNIHKEDIGREAFLEKVWEWKEKSGGTIMHQMHKLGISPAWKRSRFTMDEGLKQSVRKAFATLYKKGLIVQDNYMVNWCTHDGALSDIEVEHHDTQGKLYHLKYFLANSDQSVTIATTRPETFFGDTALMVHPEDERYQDLIGKEVTLPIIGKTIKIVADDYVDMSFGTGIVKVTPSHDINDYEVGKRHDLEFLTIFDEKGLMNEHTGEFQGLDRLESRAKVVERLKELGNLEKIEDHFHQVGHCYRCNNVVEPYISKQWFVKKETADSSIAKVNEKLVQFFPPHWLNSYNAWMNNLRPWCISRQLWWGHQIPVFYCECGAEFVSEEEHPSACVECGSTAIVQDPDVLDTWFSSALWSFSTLGWGQEPNEFFTKNDLKDFYPNSLLVTGFDILFFWVARMMIMGEEFLDELPFKHIYLHALVRDEHGNKMSKSKGNVIDPLDMVDEFSADIVRFSLAYLAAQGRDIKLGKKHLTIYRNFTNKLYNAHKYLLLNQDKFADLDEIEIKTTLGKYMQSRLNQATKEIREVLEQYRFNDAASVIYRFVWSEFCDVGIELSKASKDSIAELGAIFKEALKLTTPFMPFICEHLYHSLSATSLENGLSIMQKPYPKETSQDERVEHFFESVNDAITSIRRMKTTLGASDLDKVYVRFYSELDTTEASVFIKKLAKVSEIIFVDKEESDCFSDVSEKVQIYVKSSDFDVAPILAKLRSQEEKLSKEEQKLNGMLSNDNFVKNAPKEVLEKNTALLDDARAKLQTVQNELKRLQK